MGPALQQQLLRVPVREEVLLDMVQEYCVLRGLPTPPESATADTDIATDRTGATLYLHCDIALENILPLHEKSKFSCSLSLGL